MRNYSFLLLGCLILLSCGSPRKMSGFDDLTKRPPTYEHLFYSGYHPLLDEITFKLDSVSVDETYGYSEKNPIMVGGSIESGAYNQRRFLNALLGPGGETVTYKRMGSCCGFITPNGITGGGLLDRYEVMAGNGHPVYLYLNFYDRGVLKAPKGFLFKKQE